MATATPYQQLEQEFRRLHAFRGVLALLRWDAAVTMPRASADVRGDQLVAEYHGAQAVAAEHHGDRLIFIGQKRHLAREREYCRDLSQHSVGTDYSFTRLDAVFHAFVDDDFTPERIAAAAVARRRCGTVRRSPSARPSPGT